jgi:hypothetical protein
MDLELYVCRAQEYFDPLPSGGGVTRARPGANQNSRHGVSNSANTDLSGVEAAATEIRRFRHYRRRRRGTLGAMVVAKLQRKRAGEVVSSNRRWPALWAEDLEKLKKKIRDQEPVMSGYEPLNPNDDARVPKSMSARVTQPRPTEEMADRLLPTEE